uniref:Mitochondrial pyruvate carrier n=1 Tax=Opuntia streptacantha TaxID=393608 RepID=A0A7C8Z7Y8_OPUST
MAHLMVSVRASEVKSQGTQRKTHCDIVREEEEEGREREREFNFMAASKLQALWNHPAGPKTIHFWAPTFKWGISIANIADFSKPPEKLSYPQQIAVTCTGLVWSRYSTVITPKNWNLFSVNVAMAGTGLYQLSRKIRHDYFKEEEEAATAQE